MPGIEKGKVVHTNSAFSLPGIICVSVCVVMVVYLRGVSVYCYFCPFTGSSYIEYM